MHSCWCLLQLALKITLCCPKSDPERVGIILTLAHMRRFGKRIRIGWKIVVWALNQVYASLQLCDWPKPWCCPSIVKWENDHFSDSLSCREFKAAKYGKCLLIQEQLLIQSQFAFFSCCVHMTWEVDFWCKFWSWWQIAVLHWMEGGLCKIRSYHTIRTIYPKPLKQCQSYFHKLGWQHGGWPLKISLIKSSNLLTFV